MGIRRRNSVTFNDGTKPCSREKRLSAFSCRMRWTPPAETRATIGGGIEERLQLAPRRRARINQPPTERSCRNMGCRISKMPATPRGFHAHSMTSELNPDVGMCGPGNAGLHSWWTVWGLWSPEKVRPAGQRKVWPIGRKRGLLLFGGLGVSRFIGILGSLLLFLLAHH